MGELKLNKVSRIHQLHAKNLATNMGTRINLVDDILSPEPGVVPVPSEDGVVVAPVGVDAPVDDEPAPGSGATAAFAFGSPSAIIVKKKIKVQKSTNFEKQIMQW